MSSLSKMVSGLFYLRPRHAAAIVALVAIFVGLRQAVNEEIPVGQVRGKVLLADRNIPISDAEITIQSLPDITKESQPGTKNETLRHATSGEDGTFTIASLPEGAYHLSASTRAHSVQDLYVSVSEGQTTQTLVSLARSQADLNLTRDVKVYGTNEKAGIAIRGYIDGKKAEGTDSVRLRLFRTRLSNILAQSNNEAALESLGSSYDPVKKIPESLLAGAKPFQDKDVPITEDERDGFYYQKLKFGSLPVGLYLLDVTHGKSRACSWVLVTDTALVVKQAGTQTVAFAVNLQTGQPLPQTEIRAYRKGQIAVSRRADANGLTTFTLPAVPSNGSEGGGPGEKFTLVAVRGEDEAVYSSSRYAGENDGTFAVHTYTDRPIYRPGQRIYFKAIVRRREESSASQADSWQKYGVPQGEPVDVEIRDPQGERLLKTRLTTNRYGTVNGLTDLIAESPTGVYTIALTTRGQKHTHDFVVASYKKPEYSVRVTPGKAMYVRGETMEMTISGQYFFGSPLAGAEVKYYVYSSPDWSAEYAQDDYEESEEGEEGSGMPSYYREGNYYGERVAEGNVTLDENGKAIVQFTGSKEWDEEGPQRMTYTLSAQVKDEGDREVSETGKVSAASGDIALTLHPEGYVAMPGKPINVTVTAKDLSGSNGLHLVDLPVDIEMLYSEWKKGKYETKSAGTVNVFTDSGGRVVASLVPPRAGNLILRARARDSHNRTVLGRAEIWTVDDSGGNLGTEYADLSLLTDKKRYLPGETARVLVNTSRTGQYVLVSVEGTKVHQTQLIQAAQHSNIVRVPIKAEYGPNVFLTACYVRDKRFARSETALRVTVPQRELNVQVEADRPPSPRAKAADGSLLPRYQPGEKVTYTVSTTDKNGKPVPAEFSLGVVDEAIYALREDNPTALRDTFYPKLWNRVQTNISFAVEYLGDADKAEPKMTTRKRFPDTALWQPALQTDAAGKATVSLNLPDNLTTWRATVTAHSADTRLGRAVGKIVASKDFFVRLEKPRFLTEGDQSQILAVVHNESGTEQQTVVRLKADGLQIGGDTTQTLTLAPDKTAEVRWTVTANTIGEAKLRLTAWTTGGSRQYTDGIETSLPVKAHGREVIQYFAGQVTNKNPETEVFRTDPNAIPSASHLTVRLTPSLFSVLSGASDYLIEFPYGCAEQTTSRFLGDLYVQNLLKKKGLRDIARAEQLPRMVRSGLLRLYAMQHQNDNQNNAGGWGWFVHDTDDAWVTAYVLVGLATAKAEGYPVSSDVLAKGRAAALRIAQQTESGRRAFLLYALALAGGQAEARAERPKLLLGKLDSEGLAYTVLLDKKLGRSAAEPLALLEKRRKTGDTGTFWNNGFKANDEAVYDALRTTAIVLRALLANDPNDRRIDSTLGWLMRKRTGDYWLSTQDTAAVLAALCDYLAARPETTPGGQVNVKLNGQTVQSFTLTADSEREKEIVLRVPANLLRPDKNDLMLERTNGGSPVFYSVQWRQTVAAKEIPALIPAGYSLKREYLRVLPKRTKDSWELATEPSGNTLKVGDSVRVRLVLTVPKALEYVLIEDPFPSGMEVTERGTSEEVVEWGYWWSNVDIRDDKIAFFAAHLEPGKHVIEYNLRAQTPGLSSALPTLVQPMYAPTLRIESAEDRLTVR